MEQKLHMKNAGRANSSLISLEGAAHFAMITERDNFIEKILEFIPFHEF